jgi:hypothetical protein
MKLLFCQNKQTKNKIYMFLRYFGLLIYFIIFYFIEFSFIIFYCKISGQVVMFD